MPARSRKKVAPEPARPSSRLRNVAFVGLLSGLLAFLGALQVRSQVEVVRSLEGQDNTALAFLIDDLHRANDSLGAQAVDLAGRRDRLRTSDGSEAAAALLEEGQRLRVAEGLVPVHGPGVVLSIDAPLTALDLQDAVNNLFAAGTEAMSIEDHRVVAGTVIRQNGGAVTIDGAAVRGPWTISAIGEADRLAGVADLMTSTLRADERVRSAVYRTDPDVQIRAIVPSRPYVYGTT